MMTHVTDVMLFPCRLVSVCQCLRQVTPAGKGPPPWQRIQPHPHPHPHPQTPTHPSILLNALLSVLRTARPIGHISQWRGTTGRLTSLSNNNSSATIRQHYVLSTAPPPPTTYIRAADGRGGGLWNDRT